MRGFVCLSIALACLIWPPATVAESIGSAPTADWSQFMGAQRNGTTTEKGLNLDWAKHPPKLLWTQPLGKGFSSLAFSGDRLFTQAQREKRQYTICLDAVTGKAIWEHDAAAAYEDYQQKAAGPRATPTCVDGRVYCLFPAGELLAYEAATGKVIWSINVFEATQAKSPVGGFNYFGMTSSPIVVGGSVIVHAGGGEGKCIAAFDRDTGNLRWMSGNDPPGYGSPVHFESLGRRLVVFMTGSSILAVDPENGSIEWSFPWSNMFNNNCPSPIVVGDELFISSSYCAASALLKFEMADGKRMPREVWRNRNLMNHFSTSVVVNGSVFGTHGIFGGYHLRCLDLSSGKMTWHDRRPGHSSWIVAEEHLIGLNEGGTFFLLAANPKEPIFKGEFKALDRRAWAGPAIQNRRLYGRDEKNIVCIDLTSPPPQAEDTK